MSQDPTPSPAPVADVPDDRDGQLVDQLVALAHHMAGTTRRLDDLTTKADLQGQLLVLQAEVLREVRGLIERFGPLLEKWASGPVGKFAGRLRRPAPTDTPEVTP